MTDPLRGAWERAQDPLRKAWEQSRQPDEPTRSAASNLVRGLAQGLGTAGTSTVGAIGTLTGSRGLRDWAERSEQEMQEFYDPQGTAGRVGQFGGRVVGELASGAAAGSAGVKLATRASSRVARALEGASRVKRGAATALANAPIDIVQGAKEDEGLVLPGRVGSIIESVGLTGAAGALLPAARAGTAVAKTPEPYRGFSTTDENYIAELRKMGAGDAEIATEFGMSPDTFRRVERGTAEARGVAPSVSRETSAEQFPARQTALTEPVTDPDRYANIGRMTSEEPELAAGLRETAADAVATRELGERLPPRGKEVLGRLRQSETEEQLRANVAELFGERPSDIVARTATGERVGREGLLKATEELLESQSTINAINERLRSGLVVNADDLNRLNARLDIERQRARDLFASISTQKTETARDLAAMRLGAELSEGPVAWAERVRELAKRDLTADELARVESLAVSRDLTGLMKLGGEVRTATPWEKFVTLLKASYLTSPKSHVANLTGNVLVAAARQIRDIPATLFDVALSAKTGERTKLFDPIARAEALKRGTTRGVREAGAVMRGDLPVAQKFSEIREVNYDSAIANLYTKGVFRSLDATDRVFRNIAFAESVDEQARVLARSRGLSGDEATDFVRRINEAPPIDIAANAVMAADYATFQQTGQLAQTALDIRRRLGKVGDLLFPFVKTPANIASAIVDYSPLGVLQKDFIRNAKTLLKGPNAAAQQAVVERLGEVSLGTGIIALGYIKGMDNEMTGFYPADVRTRAEWETEGKMEGSLKVGNEWVQVSRLSPIGNLMAIGGALADIDKGDATMLPAAVSAVAAPLSAVADLPMVQGVSNITEALNPQATPEQREAAVVRMGAGVVSGAVPFSGLIRAGTQAMDPTIRETRSDSRLGSVGRSVVAGTPFASTLPEKIDPLGRTMTRGGSAVERFLSPIARQADLTQGDPVRAALDSANAVVGKLGRRKGEDPMAFRDRARFTGEVVTRAVTAATQNPTYRGADTMNVDRIRRGLEQNGVDVQGKSDADLRNAYRTLMLERAINRATSLAARARPQSGSPTARRFEQALTRQPQ